jgi:hypothetical protein
MDLPLRKVEAECQKGSSAPLMSGTHARQVRGPLEVPPAGPCSAGLAGSGL